MIFSYGYGKSMIFNEL